VANMISPNEICTRLLFDAPNEMCTKLLNWNSYSYLMHYLSFPLNKQRYRFLTKWGLGKLIWYLTDNVKMGSYMLI